MDLVDRESLKGEIQREITVMFDKILRDAELATPNQWTYKRFRTRVLDHGNDAIRRLHSIVDLYDIRKRYDLIVEKMEVEEN